MLRDATDFHVAKLNIEEGPYAAHNGRHGVLG
jgi:hypothetical protein